MSRGSQAAHIAELEPVPKLDQIGLFGNDTFPRHRHDAFIAAILKALEQQLQTNPADDDSSWIRWLPST